MPDRSEEAEELEARRSVGLWLDGHDALRSPDEAREFLGSVGFALRYNSTDGLPLASMYEAASGTKTMLAKGEKDKGEDQEWHRRAIELTNVLLSARQAIEVNVIAGRLVLVHRSLMPAVYTLRRRGKSLDDLSGLSLMGQQVYEFIRQKRNASVGQVCRHCGVKSTQYPNPVYDAITQLQRELLIDRGPSDVPREGIPYLSKEGIPYRVFHLAHKDLVVAADRLSVDQAAKAVLLGYLKPAVFAGTRKLGSMFKLCLSPEEIRNGLARLEKEEKISFKKLGRTEIVTIT